MASLSAFNTLLKGRDAAEKRAVEAATESFPDILKVPEWIGIEKAAVAEAKRLRREKLHAEADRQLEIAASVRSKRHIIVSQFVSYKMRILGNGGDEWA